MEIKLDLDIFAKEKIIIPSSGGGGVGFSRYGGGITGRNWVPPKYSSEYSLALDNRYGGRL